MPIVVRIQRSFRSCKNAKDYDGKDQKEDHQEKDQSASHTLLFCWHIEILPNNSIRFHLACFKLKFLIFVQFIVFFLLTYFWNFFREAAFSNSSLLFKKTYFRVNVFKGHKSTVRFVMFVFHDSWSEVLMEIFILQEGFNDRETTWMLSISNVDLSFFFKFVENFLHFFVVYQILFVISWRVDLVNFSVVLFQVLSKIFLPIIIWNVFHDYSKIWW